MEKKKVLFISPSLCQGGIERSLVMMLQLLDKSKYDLTLLTYHDDNTLLPLIPKEVSVVNDNLKHHYFRRPKAIGLKALITVTGLLKLKKRSQFFSGKLKDYIHLQKAKTPSATVFRKNSFDVVISNAIGICTEMALFIRAKKRYVFYRSSVDMHHEMLTRVFPEYDGIIAVSPGVKEMLSENYPHVKDKISVIENYVDAEDVIRKSKEPVQVEAAPGRTVICTCGRLSEEKGFDLAVEAAALLRDRGLDFIWYFVGDGGEREKLEGMIKEHSLENRIIITGFLDNPFPYVKACDIYVQPSYHESFGRTIKEAVILGKPVVSTDTAGAHTVLEDGRYGEITDVSSSEIEEGVRRSISRLRNGYPYAKYELAENEKEKHFYIKQLEEIF